jgi:hypothetical protein
VPEARQIRGIYWKEVEGLASSSLQRRPSAFEAEMEGRACKSALEAKGDWESCRFERPTISSLRLGRWYLTRNCPAAQSRRVAKAHADRHAARVPPKSEGGWCGSRELDHSRRPDSHLSGSDLS